VLQSVRCPSQSTQAKFELVRQLGGVSIGEVWIDRVDVPVAFLSATAQTMEAPLTILPPLGALLLATIHSSSTRAALFLSPTDVLAVGRF
jgi:hypothetical protein